MIGKIRRSYGALRDQFKDGVLSLTMPSVELVDHIKRQREWSLRTFGPDTRLDGILDHMAKEIVEVRESNGDLSEWVDLIILALDGAWRSGAGPHEIVAALTDKQRKNEQRTWPDWRSAEPGKAIEHDRSADAP